MYHSSGGDADCGGVHGRDGDVAVSNGRMHVHPAWLGIGLHLLTPSCGGYS
ncbi:hypothetical protein K7H08_12775 [Halomonas sp. IOP_6]|uniref:hypothetical protein n=1 Tax=Halomonas sp. IOP_6 TaxID=2876583 RepID=UPI001E5F4F68|nr:hypothetical protein [Halomonas sp. IOP_6]MCD6005710.1 hypothetical protein [Halomonas sp. IOP_6]